MGAGYFVLVVKQLVCCDVVEGVINFFCPFIMCYFETGKFIRGKFGNLR